MDVAVGAGPETQEEILGEVVRAGAGATATGLSDRKKHLLFADPEVLAIAAGVAVAAEATGDADIGRIDDPPTLDVTTCPLTGEL